jgi:hypothetical protein
VEGRSGDELSRVLGPGLKDKFKTGHRSFCERERWPV